MALRRSSLLLSRALLSRSSLETLTKTPQLQINPTTFLSQSKPFSSSSSSSTVSNHNLFFSPSRSFCSSSEPSPSNFVVVKSEEEFDTSLNKAQGDSLPAVFYFTASWCGPCKLISPIIQELSKKYPNVTTYKIDVDQKELQSTLENLQIYSVPTLHFFKDGKKANEMVGADVGSLKQTMESLYNPTTNLQSFTLLLLLLSRYRSFCSSTTHGDDDGTVNAPARISQGEPVKRKPPGRPHQKVNELDNESTSTTHHGVKASLGGTVHGEGEHIVKRKSPGRGKPGKQSNEPDESCSTNYGVNVSAGRTSHGKHVKRKPPGRPCKKLDQPTGGMIYFLPLPSLTLSEQTHKRDRIRPPKSGPPRGGKRREVVQSPPDFPNRGRIGPSKNGKKKDEKKEVRNTFRRAGYIFNR